jgi:PAS domain S-box-containing protein
MDMGLKVNYISPSTEKLLGYSSEEQQQFSLDKTLTPDSLNAAMNFLNTEIPRAQAVSQDYVLNRALELEFVCKDGHTVWEECMFSLIWNEDGKSVSILGEGRNINERKQIESALRESEENFRHSLDESPLGVRISTIEGETLYANRAILNMYGYDSVEELKNISAKDRYTQESYAEFQARKEKRLMGEFGPSEYEVSIVRKNGDIRHLHVFRKEIFWDGRKQSQVIYQDITERKQAEEKLNRTLENLRQSIRITIQVLGLASEARDPYTAGHHKRVSSLARAIAKEKGLPHDTVEGIRMAGSVHDIGKIAVPGEILSKSTKLTDNEFSLIKEHPYNGYEMLRHVESPWPLAQIVYQHHERMNGSGYPKHLKGDDILMEARIMAVADVVDAMSCHRPYRPALGIEAALEEIEINKGVLYDESVVEACLKLFREKKYQFT